MFTDIFLRQCHKKTAVTHGFTPLGVQGGTITHCSTSEHKIKKMANALHDFLDPRTILQFRKYLKQKDILPLFYMLQHANELDISPFIIESVIHGHVLPNSILILPLNSNTECVNLLAESCHFLLMMLPDYIEREGLYQEYDFMD
jgi:hypothetical protein